jgi:hypothetical protein
LRRFISLMPLALAVSFAACASSGTTAGPQRAPDMIIANELEGSGATNALQAIERLRPNWMRERGTGSIAGSCTGGAGTPCTMAGIVRSQMIVVYLDGQRLGDVTSLRTLSVTGIRTMQWLDAARASTVLPGLAGEAVAGAIVIKTK